MILGGIPAKENHKAPGKSLAGDDIRCLGKTLAGAPARPLPRTPAGPPSGPRRLNLHHRMHTAAVLTSWEAPAWRHADLREDPPLRHLSCLPTYMASQASLARALSTQEGAATDETCFSPVPDKARTPKQDALNVPCHVMRGITSHNCTLSTSCVPLWQPLFL